MSRHANDTATNMSDSDTPPVRATIEEAARILGLSENAVRKRIERGTLRSEKAGGTRYVLLDGDMSQHANDERPGMAHDVPPGMSEFVASLQDQIVYLRTQLDQEREANRENRRLLAAALERIPELEAPREPPESPETASEERYMTHAPPEQQEPVSWWRKIFGG